MVNPYFKDVLTNLDQISNKKQEDINDSLPEVISIDKEFCKRVEPYWFISYIAKDNNILVLLNEDKTRGENVNGFSRHLNDLQSAV